ncbi:MAG: ABC transporter substrate-binding protein [Thermoleophilia bacterium]|jgi:peptide/nickel transport system substrate-binding protein|nr:ABC transporter substrate-binding protein [Thermoleophilia bacterium]
MKRLSVLAAVLAAGVLMLGAAAPATAESPSASPAADEAIYRLGTTQDYDGFNPFSHWAGITWDTFRQCYNFLTWYDEEYQPAPDLAESWEVSDDSLVWTFTIRDGMTWHDGEPLTARDIAFTYNLILDQELYAYLDYLAGVTEVEAVDDTTLVITCDKPNAGMLALYIPILPEHIWSKVPADEIETYENVPLVGSGPFQMVEAKKSEWVRLEPNLSYPEELGGPPKLDAFYYIISQNMDSMIQDYKAGNLDAIVDWPASQFADLETQPGTQVVKGPAIGFHQMGFNCWDSPKSKGNPLLRDAAIRTALHWAIDKESIATTAMGGVATVGTSLISPVQGEWHYDVPEEDLITFDPARAMQLLEDSGYSDRDGDGVRENAAGAKLEFRITALNEYPEDQAAAKKIVSYARDVGIALELITKDEGAFNDDWYDSFNYDVYLWSWGGDIDPGFMLSCFTTGQIEGWSDCQYSNPEYDALYMQQQQAVNPDDAADTAPRKAVTDQMQAILYRDNPYVILWYNVNLQAFRTDTWTGYHMVPPQGEGSPFWNMMRATYQDLEPVSGEEVDEGGSNAWVWILVALVAVAVVVVIVLRGRSNKAEVE